MPQILDTDIITQNESKINTRGEFFLLFERRIAKDRRTTDSQLCKGYRGGNECHAVMARPISAGGYMPKMVNFDFFWKIYVFVIDIFCRRVYNMLA